MRKRLWQFHSWLGLIVGLGLVVIGLTGSILVFHDEIENALNPALTRVDPLPSGRLPLADLVAAVNRQLPDYEIAGWILDRADPGHADFLYIRRHGAPEWLVASLNPYTGVILARPHDGETTVTGWLLELHYAFLADHIGAFIAGLFGVALCLLGVSGIYLYRDFWKTVFTFRWGRSRRILFSDIHKFIGITTVAFNLVLGFTGAWWNLTHIIGHWIDGEDDEKPAPAMRLYADGLPFDRLFTDAATRIPGFQINYVDFPADPGAPLTLLGAAPGHFLNSPYGSSVAYDAQTGAFQSATDLRQAALWPRILDTFVPLHYGTFGGLPVKILWSLGGLTPGALAVTGFFMWRLRQRRASQPVAVRPPSP